MDRRSTLLSFYSLDISEMKSIVKSYLKCRLKNKRCGSNHLYIGPPGIGKSKTVVEAAKEVASEEGLEFWEFENALEPPSDLEKSFVLVLFRLDMVKPEDLSGFPLPNKKDGTFDYAIPRWTKVLRKARGGVIVLDEFTNINDDILLSAAYDIVLSEKVNLYYFKKPVIALGNPPEASSLSRPLPLPLLNRLSLFNVKEPSVEDWCEYMSHNYRNEWASELCNFLKTTPDLLIKLPEDTEELRPYPTPRSWTNLAVALKNTYTEIYEKLKARDQKVKNMAFKIISSYVGTEVAEILLNWFYISLPSLDEILKDLTLIDELNDDQMTMLVQMLAQYKHPHWKARITKIISRMLRDNKKVRFVAMLLRLMEDKKRSEFIEYLRKKNPSLFYDIRSKIGGKEVFGGDDDVDDIVIP